jgi:hypothetical protein
MVVNSKPWSHIMQTAQIIPFKFEAREVRTLLIDDQPWFVANDISEALQYSVASAMTRHLDDDEKGVSTVHTLGGEQEMLVINESGLYSAILRSRKAEAKRFKKWITAEVLPTIRKTGRYADTDSKMGTLIGETIGTNGFNMLGSLIKGKVVSLPAQTQRRATAKIWSQTHAAFGVRSAADIPASQLDAARNFIAAYALEGEWLPPVERGTALDETAQNNLRALCHHAEWLLKNWNASLQPALRQVDSPLAGYFHDHFVSAASLARSMHLRAANQSG